MKIEAREAHHDRQHDEHEQEAARVEHHHEQAQLLERRHAVLAGGERNRAEHAERRELDDERHDAEEHVRQFVDKNRHALRLLAEHRERRAKQDREHEHLKNVAFREGIDRGVGMIFSRKPAVSFRLFACSV